MKSGTASGTAEHVFQPEQTRNRTPQTRMAIEFLAEQRAEQSCVLTPERSTPLLWSGTAEQAERIGRTAKPCIARNCRRLTLRRRCDVHRAEQPGAPPELAEPANREPVGRFDVLVAPNSPSCAPSRVRARPKSLANPETETVRGPLFYS